MTKGKAPSSALEEVSAVSDELEVGALVGEYRVEGKLGEGGFGKVYHAVHPVIGKRAAIKVLNREYSANASVVSRFVSEARAVNQIRHRNIIDIFAFGTLEGGLQYFVMELLDGVTLDAYLAERRRLPVEEALPILRYIARALDAAHQAGIAHRDLKPENVFLTFDEDAGVFPKLLDFGIAKLMGDDSVGHKTRTGAAMGTPLYMSPEQCHGKNVDHRTDVYSFGVMTHQMLTGHYPFDGDSMMELMLKHVQEAPPPMSELAPDLPKALDAAVLQMLAKRPDDRPSSLVEAVERLSAAAREAGIAVASGATRSHDALRGVQGSRASISKPEIEEAATALSATAADGPTALGLAPATSTAGASPAITQHTMEAESRPAPRSRAWLVGAIVLAAGAAVTLALVTGDDPAPGADGPASAADGPAPADGSAPPADGSALPADGSAPPADGAAATSAPTSDPARAGEDHEADAASPTESDTEPSSAPTAAANASSPPPPAGGPRPNMAPVASPPLPAPPPPPAIPDDLEY